MAAPKFETKKIENLYLIRLPNLAYKELRADLEIQIKQWLLTPELNFVLDFSDVLSLESSLTGLLVRFCQTLKKAEKTVFSFNVPNPVLEDLKAKGLVKTFGYAKNLDEIKLLLNPAPTTTPVTKPKMDISILQPFVDGATKAFAVQVKLNLSAGKMTAKKQLFEPDDAVVGQISLETSGFTGLANLCFPEKVFFHIYKALLGDEITSLDVDSAEAAAELLNMIYGHAKTVLNQSLGLQLKPALPKVLLRPGVQPALHPVIVLPFSSEVGPFRIEIMVQ